MHRPDKWKNLYDKENIGNTDPFYDSLMPLSACEEAFEAGADAMGIQTACLVLNIMFYKVPSVVGDKSGEWWESELKDKDIPIEWDRELGEFIPEEK